MPPYRCLNVHTYLFVEDRVVTISSKTSESRVYRWIPLTSGLKEPAESWISGRKRSLRCDVRLTSPWTVDGGPPSGEPGHPGSPNEGLEGGCPERRPPAQFEV